MPIWENKQTTKKNLQSTCKRGMGMEGNVRNVPETPQWEKGRRKRRFSRCWSRDVPALACGGDHSEVESSCSPWRTAPEQVPLLHPSGRPYATVGGLKRKLEPLERPHRCRFSGRNCGPWGTPAPCWSSLFWRTSLWAGPALWTAACRKDPCWSSLRSPVVWGKVPVLEQGKNVRSKKRQRTTLKNWWQPLYPYLPCPVWDQEGDWVWKERLIVKKAESQNF